MVFFPIMMTDLGRSALRMSWNSLDPTLSACTRNASVYFSRYPHSLRSYCSFLATRLMFLDRFFLQCDLCFGIVLSTDGTADVSYQGLVWFSFSFHAAFHAAGPKQRSRPAKVHSCLSLSRKGLGFNPGCGVRRSFATWLVGGDGGRGSDSSWSTSFPSPPSPLLVRPNRDPIEKEPTKGIQSNTIQGRWRRLSHPNPRGVGAKEGRCPSIRHRDEVGKRCGIPPYLRGKRATINHARERFEGPNEAVAMHVKNVKSTKENFKGVRPHGPTVPTDRPQQPPVQRMEMNPCPVPPCPSNSSSEEALSKGSTVGTPSEQHQVHGTSRVGFGKGSQPEEETTHPKRLETYVCKEVLLPSFEVRRQQTRLLHLPS